MATLLTLDKKGALAALIVGVWILVLGGSEGIFFLAVMLLFLILSALASMVGIATKKKAGVYERSRGWRNVVANGIIPMLAVLAYHLLQLVNNSSGPLLIAAYVASVAAITSDKFASELGVLSGNPRLLMTFKKVKRGTSGAVSLGGLVVSFFGAALIGICLLPVGFSLIVVGLVIVAGFLGNMVDSLFGYFETKGIGNKFTTNIFCSLSGWMFSLIFILYFFSTVA